MLLVLIVPSVTCTDHAFARPATKRKAWAFRRYRRGTTRNPCGFDNGWWFGFRLVTAKYRNETAATNIELADLEIQVRSKGYVLLWSNLLEDFVAFYGTEADLGQIPDIFVLYSEAEIWELFGDVGSGPSRNGLWLIHETKKLGGHIVPSI